MHAANQGLHPAPFAQQYACLLSAKESHEKVHLSVPMACLGGALHLQLQQVAVPGQAASWVSSSLQQAATHDRVPAHP